MTRIFRFSAADFKAMPWKNGNGLTTELIIEPPCASLTGGFDWRLSMAVVKESGPFSCLMGVDRTILILEGNGMELNHGVHGKSFLTSPLIPVTFNGDWDTFGSLLSGPCVDFNVMTDRTKVRHNVLVVRPKLESVFLPKVQTVLVFCVKGNAYLTDTKEAIISGELLRIDLQSSDIDIELRTTDQSTVLVVVSITSTKVA